MTPLGPPRRGCPITISLTSKNVVLSGASSQILVYVNFDPCLSKARDDQNVRSKQEHRDGWHKYSTETPAQSTSHILLCAAETLYELAGTSAIVNSRRSQSLWYQKMLLRRSVPTIHDVRIISNIPLVRGRSRSSSSLKMSPLRRGCVLSTGDLM